MALSFLLYVPAIIGFDYWRGSSTVEDGDCDVEFASELWYTLLAALLEFVVPFSLLTIFSSMLYVNIYKRSKSISREQDSGIKQKAQQLRKDKKRQDPLLILIVTYAICWIPYTISTVVISICDYCVQEYAYEFFTWLLWFNSSVNPFLYAFTNRRFRAHYKRMMCAISNNTVHPVIIQIRELTVESAGSRR